MLTAAMKPIMLGVIMLSIVMLNFPYRQTVLAQSKLTVRLHKGKIHE